jgi:flagellar hook-length control protein FliK
LHDENPVAQNSEGENEKAFGKVLKEVAVPVKKESTDSGTVSTRHISASDILGKLTDVKHSPDTPVSSGTDKTLPSYVTDQVVKQVSRAVKNGDTEIRFHIRPPEMGRVQLSIESTKEGIKVNIMAENNTARDLLLNQASELKTILADQGIRLEKINVGLAGDFGHSMAQARQDADQSGKERRNRDKSPFNMENIAEIGKGDSGPEMKRYIRGNLDLVA